MASNTAVDIIEIMEGPGEIDFITALLRGGVVQITLKGGKKYRVRIEERKSWELTGDDMIELSPGVWVPLNDAHYSPRGRSGQIILKKLEEHPLCLHLVPKGVRRCPTCGADRMDVS